jgi:hypothetical protein
LPLLSLSFLVVIPEGDLLLSLLLYLFFSCHPSPKAEDLLLPLQLAFWLPSPKSLPLSEVEPT